MKQTTAPNRMGSHSALSSVMTFSPVLRDSCCYPARRFCSRISAETTSCTRSPAANPICTRRASAPSHIGRSRSPAARGLGKYFAGRTLRAPRTTPRGRFTWIGTAFGIREFADVQATGSRMTAVAWIARSLPFAVSAFTFRLDAHIVVGRDATIGFPRRGSSRGVAAAPLVAYPGTGEVRSLCAGGNRRGVRGRNRHCLAAVPTQYAANPHPPGALAHRGLSTRGGRGVMAVDGPTLEVTARGRRCRACDPRRAVFLLRPARARWPPTVGRGGRAGGGSQRGSGSRSSSAAETRLDPAPEPACGRGLA